MREFNLKLSDAVTSNSSDGQLLKWNINIGKESLYIKSSSFNEFNRCWLYESYSELIVCRLLKELGNTNMVMYYPCKINLDNNTTIFGCYSKSFLKEDEKYISIAHICKVGQLQDKYTFEGYTGYTALINDIQTKYGINIKEFLDENIEIDYITLNQDRHLGNLGIIYNYRTNTLRPAPIFDNGNSLFSTSDISQFMYDTTLDEYIKAKPFYYKHHMQIQLVKNRKYRGKNINKTLSYVDRLQQYGLDKHRIEFIKTLLTNRINM